MHVLAGTVLADTPLTLRKVFSRCSINAARTVVHAAACREHLMHDDACDCISPIDDMRAIVRVKEINEPGTL